MKKLIITILVLAMASVPIFAQIVPLDLGGSANDRSGTKIRDGGIIINANFSYLDGIKADTNDINQLETALFIAVGDTVATQLNGFADTVTLDSLRAGTGRVALTDYVIYPPHVHMFFNDSAELITLAANTYAQITNAQDSLFRVRFESNGLTVSGDTIQLIDEEAHYKYTASFSFRTSSADVVRIALYDNNAGLIQSFATSTTVNSNIEEITLTGIYYNSAAAANKVWFMIKTTGGADVTMIDGSVTFMFYHRTY